MLRFFGAKDEHPLADAKEVRRICAELDELGKHDAVKCVGEATGWFEALAGLDALPASLRHGRCVDIAAVSLPAARRIARDHLATRHASRLQAQQSWRRNHDYWFHLVQALTRCLADLDADKKAAALQAQLLTGLLSAHFGCLRWLRLRYDPVAGERWGQIGDAYLRACRAGCAEQPVAPFDAAAETTTAAREFLRALVFQAASLDKLTPIEIALAERLIADCLPHCILSDTPRPGCLHWVDAGKPLPPTRLAKPPVSSPALRYFGAGEAVATVAALREQILATRELPAQLRLAPLVTTETVLHVLAHLAACWSPSPRTRSFPRHRVKSRVYVRIGRESLQRLLSGNDAGYQDESWEVEDVSQGGMSIRLPRLPQEPVGIGTLIGLWPEGGEHWLIGVVRRYAHNDDGRGVAGIETLSQRPRAANASDGAFQTELILLDPPCESGSARVICAPSEWETGVPLSFMLDERRWRLLPETRLESAADWMVGRCAAEAAG